MFPTRSLARMVRRMNRDCRLPNVLGLSRAVPNCRRSATDAAALREPARPADQRTAPRRLLTRVSRPHVRMHITRRPKRSPPFGFDDCLLYLRTGFSLTRVIC
jgi:hypothetical protein